MLQFSCMQSCIHIIPYNSMSFSYLKFFKITFLTWKSFFQNLVFHFWVTFWKTQDCFFLPPIIMYCVFHKNQNTRNKTWCPRDSSCFSKFMFFCQNVLCHWRIFNQIRLRLNNCSSCTWTFTGFTKTVNTTLITVPRCLISACWSCHYLI